ncbi:hypothetical protein [Campylobacter ureolyticus]|uniref:hypothetical protein n=1 Tax=Campylobacter ureolyticus TaxID=827 RepID=UPI00143E6F38|nr:hypothetical protein [Campylobacter ureolyticus]QIX87187.1 hypothetical protein FOB81_07915 [Campylobacter ureolyticus]
MIKQIKENFTSYKLSDEDINKYKNILKDEEKRIWIYLKFDKTNLLIYTSLQKNNRN